jgi:hypothetical protein
MSTIKSSTEHLTLNADGSGKDIKFQANGVEKASISSAGAFTSTSIDATKLSGTVPNFTSTGIDDNATSTAITIDASENVLVGTTSMPSYSTSSGSYFAYKASQKYIVSGQATSGYANFYMHNNTGNTNNAVQFRYSGTAVGSISISSTSTSYYTSSDYRLKELDVPMEGSIDRLKALRPINFAWKADGSRTDGFFAHEAQEVVPECATGTKDAMKDEEYEVTPAVMDGDTVVTEAVMGTRSVPDYQGIDQSKLVPLLVASLQEAVAKIEALEARVTALEV